MPDFLPVVELGAKAVRGALAYVGAAIDCGIPMASSQPSPAASAAAETGPEAVSARAESAAPASGLPGDASATGLAIINRSIAEMARIASLCCWCLKPESDNPPCCAMGFEARRRLGRRAIRKTSAAAPPAAVDDPAGTPPPAGSPQNSSDPIDGSPVPEFDWVTAAIPVIAGVLAEHVPMRRIGPWRVSCERPDGTTCAELADWRDWYDHVAPHIAAAIQIPCPSTLYDDVSLVINALRMASFSQDRPRPLSDFPQHQNPRM